MRVFFKKLQYLFSISLLFSSGLVFADIDITYVNASQQQARLFQKYIDVLHINAHQHDRPVSADEYIYIVDKIADKHNIRIRRYQSNHGIIVVVQNSTNLLDKTTIW